MKKHLLAFSVLSAAIGLGMAGQTAMAADVPSTATTTQESTRLATSYTDLAGSMGNAQALVSGLRSGTAIVLVTPATATSPAVQTSFTPATGKLGFGNVNIALSLAQAELTKAGITQPTAAQLQAALNGGAVTTTTGTVQFPGVLALRAEGQGWGQIAKTLGFKLGDVVSAAKAKGPLPESSDMAHGNKSEKADKADKAEKADKADKPDKANRPDKPEHPDKVDRPDKPERGGGR